VTETLAVRPAWKTKRDPQQHPVRFLAGIWEQRTGQHLTPKELGQLRDLRKNLDDLTRHVVEWMLDPDHWWRFCQYVQSQSGPGLHPAPPHPHVGFLLKHRGRALNIMRSELRHSTAAPDVSFCARLDQLRYNQLKSLVLVYAAGKPDWLARIDAAQTPTDLDQVFIDIVDEPTTVSTSLPVDNHSESPRQLEIAEDTSEFSR
jgi:hypothetical protein